MSFISELFKGIAQFTVWARVNICLKLPYLVPTQFQESISTPLARQKVSPLNPGGSTWPETEKIGSFLL
jgi:hypothetical protein